MFIDTNILVTSRILESPDHMTAREMLARAIESPEPVRISRQVMREYLVVLTRPQTWSIAISRTDALDDVNRLASNFEVLEDGPLVSDFLMTICREVLVGGKQIHDANIVATMLAHGERRLLTFNTTDFLRYGDRIELVNIQGP